MSPRFTKAEMEAGRLLFAGDWQFFFAAADANALPRAKGVEIAFAGRSNVGKSSLVNALTGRKALARTSNTPGRTQELIFFQGPSELAIVDMPGYGYAEAPKDKARAWGETVTDYLRERKNLARVYVLIDARHGIKPTDLPTLDHLGKSAVSHTVVLTKADQISAAARQSAIAAAEAAIARRAAAFPDVFATSSRDGEGIAELRAAIARLLAERR